MISVVIPVYNEEMALPETLAQLFLQAGHYEVIAVDGGSSDATNQVLKRFPRVQVLAAPKGRAAQMNRGTAEAKGEWLLFLHADTPAAGRGVGTAQCSGSGCGSPGRRIQAPFLR